MRTIDEADERWTDPWSLCSRKSSSSNDRFSFPASCQSSNCSMICVKNKYHRASSVHESLTYRSSFSRSDTRLLDQHLALLFIAFGILLLLHEAVELRLVDTAPLTPAWTAHRVRTSSLHGPNRSHSVDLEHFHAVLLDNTLQRPI